MPNHENILLDYITFSSDRLFGVRDIREKWHDLLCTVPTSAVQMYVHIPFCATICRYCMYNTLPIKSDSDMSRYVAAVMEYLSGFAEVFRGASLCGLYVGGGTPSLLSVGKMKELFGYVFSRFQFDGSYHRTIELNPGSTTLEKLDALRHLGFTRVSFGVQSFDESTLSAERRFYASPDLVGSLVRHARAIGFQAVNVDLIVGLADEGCAQLTESLRVLQEIAPSTITLYTILKDMERSVLYNKDRDVFYARIADITDRALRSSGILETYDRDEWSKILGCTLRAHNFPDPLIGYEAHSTDRTSVFGVGYKAYARIWGHGSYESHTFDAPNFVHAFSPRDREDELYAYVLQAFQFRIDPQEFSDIFHEDFLEKFAVEVDYLRSLGVVDVRTDGIYYVGDEKMMGYYGLLLLDGSRLVRFIKQRFYGTK